MQIFGLIPARGGSKGIPRKNVLPIAGKPLIGWTIEAALASPLLDAVIVSTDDEEIADVARGFGAQVPFMRPTALAQDDSPGIDPVLHAVEHMPGFDALVLLQATSPLRTTGDIDGCLELAVRTQAASVVSVAEAEIHPQWMYTIAADGSMQRIMREPGPARRQDLKPVYALNGACYFAQIDWLRAGRRLIDDDTRAFQMEAERSIDIDTELQWRIAEMLLNRRGNSR